MRVRCTGYCGCPRVHIDDDDGDDEYDDNHTRRAFLVNGQVSQLTLSVVQRHVRDLRVAVSVVFAVAAPGVVDRRALRNVASSG